MATSGPQGGEPWAEDDLTTEGRIRVPGPMDLDLVSAERGDPPALPEGEVDRVGADGGRGDVRPALQREGAVVGGEQGVGGGQEPNPNPSGLVPGLAPPVAACQVPSVSKRGLTYSSSGLSGSSCSGRSSPSLDKFVLLLLRHPIWAVRPAAFGSGHRGGRGGSLGECFHSHAFTARQRQRCAPSG